MLLLDDHNHRLPVAAGFMTHVWFSECCFGFKKGVIVYIAQHLTDAYQKLLEMS